tara:strand:- start:2719 stop:3843 length:1125 start_codon:yes stop_codon:yes gene_type:complete
MKNKKANNQSFDQSENLDNNIKESFAYDFLQIPEDSIYIENGEDLNNCDLVFQALQISISERDLDNSFKVKRINNISRNIININKFYTQIVYAKPFDEKVKIPINPWLIRGKAPQIILAVQVDDENSMVNFVGIMTSNEFKSLVSSKDKKLESITLPLSAFNGDIDLLFSFVKSFNNRILSKNGLSENLEKQNNPKYLKKEPILLFGLSFTIITSLILGERLLKPNIASKDSAIVEEYYSAANSLNQASFSCGNYKFKDFTLKFLNEIKESKFININSLGCSQIKKIDNLDSSKILITTGRKNKKSISCLTDNKSEPCKFVLGEFYNNTLSPRIALKTIFDYEEKKEEFLNETNSRLFINIYDSLTKKYKNFNF